MSPSKPDKNAALSVEQARTMLAEEAEQYVRTVHERNQAASAQHHSEYGRLARVAEDLFRDMSKTLLALDRARKQTTG